MFSVKETLVINDNPYMHPKPYIIAKNLVHKFDTLEQAQQFIEDTQIEYVGDHWFATNNSRFLTWFDFEGNLKTAYKPAIPSVYNQIRINDTAEHNIYMIYP